jgi:p-hydroxybenzoate 3-monooxygenase
MIASMPPCYALDRPPHFDRQIQRAELEYLLSSRAAMTALAENYVGPPY